MFYISVLVLVLVSDCLWLLVSAALAWLAYNWFEFEWVCRAGQNSTVNPPPHLCNFSVGCVGVIIVAQIWLYVTIVQVYYFKVRIWCNVTLSHRCVRESKQKRDLKSDRALWRDYKRAFISVLRVNLWFFTSTKGHST